MNEDGDASRQTAAGAAARDQAPLRCGVLGTGYWAWWCHGTALAADPEIDFVGLWGRNPAKAAEAVGRVGAGESFDDLDALLDRVDAVAIALPPDVQAPLAVRAARAGKHLLLDKPLALDPEAADEVVAAVQDAEVATVTFFTLRFQPEVIGWLDQMRGLADEHGPWEGAYVRCAGSIDQPDSPYADSVWRQERGGLWDLGPHALSVVGALLPPVRAVSAAQGVRDTVNLALEHEGGPGSILSLTVTAPPAAQESRAVVWGPAGLQAITLPSANPREAYRGAVDALREAIRTGQPHPLNVRYARDQVAILAAAWDHRGAAIPVR